MTEPLLLDTCALIWASGGLNGSDLLRGYLLSALDAGETVWVSPISVWELGNMAARGRLGLVHPILPWFEALVARSHLKQTEIGAKVLAASTNLPGTIHSDPADRIIVATAREYGLRLVTRDRKILDYAERGHVMALAC